ncbi:hypothetical protein [Cellvibrio sp. pealriver]|uniref:hypothetical protein n=1 Tax=Cellvibrio sp. pealriver TaxID=1622269 RepID=UPI00066FD18C|nr:hypothetical protein [Cellvibrio sp. pealriver]
MKLLLALSIFFMSVCVFADTERGIKNYKAIVTGEKKYESLSKPEIAEVDRVVAMINSGFLIIPAVPFKPSEEELDDGYSAAVTYANGSTINGQKADPCILANLMAGDNMRGDGAARAGFQSCIVGGGGVIGSTYKVQAVSKNSSVFVVADTAYFAASSCPGINEGDQVTFVPDAYSTCAGRTFVNVQKEIICRLKCS